MMSLRINGGTLKITDDNKTEVSSNIAKEIKDTSSEKPDGKEGWQSPDLIIKD